MKTVSDVRKLLIKYGILIYTRNRLADLELMEDELKDLYQAKILEVDVFTRGLLILRQEKARLK